MGRTTWVEFMGSVGLDTLSKPKRDLQDFLRIMRQFHASLTEQNEHYSDDCYRYCVLRDGFCVTSEESGAGVESAETRLKLFGVAPKKTERFSTVVSDRVHAEQTRIIGILEKYTDTYFSGMEVRVLRAKTTTELKELNNLLVEAQKELATIAAGLVACWEDLSGEKLRFLTEQEATKRQLELKMRELKR